MKSVVIVGTGGHGREIFDVLRALEGTASARPVAGFVDDDPTHVERLDRLGVRLLGDLEHLARVGGEYLVGIGTSATRRMVVERLGDGCTPSGLVHPGASIGSDCNIGDDVFLGSGAIITRGVTVGDGPRVGAGAVVLSDVAPGQTVVGVPARSR